MNHFHIKLNLLCLTGFGICLSLVLDAAGKVKSTIQALDKCDECVQRKQERHQPNVN